MATVVSLRIFRWCSRVPRRVLVIICANIAFMLIYSLSTPVCITHKTENNQRYYPLNVIIPRNTHDQDTDHVNQNRQPLKGKLFCTGLTTTHCIPPIERPKMAPPSNLELYCDIIRLCANEKTDINLRDKTNVCPCIPEDLHGDIYPNATRLLSKTWDEVENTLGNVAFGGHWRPDHCVPRRRVAVIVPYRDREQQLRAFLLHYHPLFQRQHIEYQIFVIEQNTPYIFNKGALMNVGFLESQKLFGADCILFVDVDTLAERDDNIILCGETPVHWASFVDRRNDTFDPTLFGAAVILSKDQFKRLNGFSNAFWGWGGEDDNFLHRILHEFGRYEATSWNVGQFFLLDHDRDVTNFVNPERHYLLHYAQNNSVLIESELVTLDYVVLRLYNSLVAEKTPSYTWTHKGDGLNSVMYKVIDTMKTPLYTWIQTDILEPDWNFLNSSRFKSMAKNSYQKNVVRLEVNMTLYHKIPGRCVFIDKTKHRQPYSKSVITCKFMCSERADCKGFQYTKSKNSDSFCVLFEQDEGCTVMESKDTAELNTVYIVSKYKSLFPVVS